MGGSNHKTLDRRAPGEESRRFTVEWCLVAGYRSEETLRGQVRNISLSGALIRVPAPYVIESLIEIEMSPAVRVHIRAIVQVMREHAAGHEWFEYGVRIVSQNEEDSALLKEALLAVRRAEVAADFGRAT